MDADVEIRLRIIEALTRTDGSMARNNTQAFLQTVAEIENYVKKENEAKAEPTAKRGRPKVDPADDFMS